MDTITFAIGDVHGCRARLEKLMEICAAYADRRPFRIVMLGDYIDRGPDSAGSVRLLRELSTKRPDALICLKGNHEDMMLATAEHPDDDGMWIINGGAATLKSYKAASITDVPAIDIEWMNKLPTSFDDGLRHFVHAGVDPTKPLDQQIDGTRLWVREPWLSGDHDVGRLVVHGHTPLSQTQKPHLKKHRLNLDTAAVFGGPLTAAAFTADQRNPVAFLNDRGEITELREREKLTA